MYSKWTGKLPLSSILKKYYRCLAIKNDKFTTTITIILVYRLSSKIDSRITSNEIAMDPITITSLVVNIVQSSECLFLFSYLTIA